MLLKRNKAVKPKDVDDSWRKTHRMWLEELELKKGARVALSSLLRQIATFEEESKILAKEIESLSRTYFISEAGTTLF
jgi:septation ring formation regulator EzrA